MTDNHVEQNNPILFALNAIGCAVEFFVTMLTDWINDVHDFENQQTTCLNSARCEPLQNRLRVAYLGLICNICVKFDTTHRHRSAGY
jgi:hypothetical protein